MLQFVFGRAATGKTTWIHQQIQAEVNRKNRALILLVPEQNTFENEKAMLSLLGDGFMSMVSVLSFTRLCETAGQQYGGLAGLTVTDSQRRILLSKVLCKTASQLQVFRKYVSSAGFIRSMEQILQELKVAGVTGEMLMKASQEVEQKVLCEKLQEIAMIYAEYDNALKGVYIDPLDALDRFYQQAVEHSFFRGKTVFIDAFKGFTGQQLKVLKLVISQADKVVFSVCCEPTETSGGVGVFSNINILVEQLKAYAKEQQIPLEKPVVLTESHYQNPALHRLERLLGGEAMEHAPQEEEGVTLAAFETPAQEVDFVLKTIHKLVRTKGYRFEDFVIIARDISLYERRLLLAAEKFEVPCYLDKRRRLLTSPIARFVLSLLQAAYSFSTESIFAMLKTGFFGLDSDEIARLEEYVYVWSIEKSAWKTEWTMEPRGLVAFSNDMEKTQSVLTDLNGLRQRIIGALIPMNRAFSSSVFTLSKTIYQTLINLSCDKAVQHYCEALLSKNSEEDADFVMDSWDAVMSVLDDMVRCYGEDILPPNVFIEQLELAFSGVTLGTLPRTLDEVSCGSADRIRPGRPKVVFVIGLGLDEFPAPANEKGILLKFDRQQLEKAGIDLNDRYQKSAVEEGFLAYSSLCCATERVYALRHCFGNDGMPVEESPIYSRLKSVFDEGLTAVEAPDYPETTAEAFDRLAVGFSAGDSFSVGLREILSSHEEYDFRMTALERAKFRTERRISPTVMDEIYHHNIYLSASKIEMYNKCPFSYFCRYVLKIDSLQKAELNSLQRGTIVHYVLEHVLCRLGEQIVAVDDETIQRLINESIADYLAEVQGAAYLEEPRFRFLCQEIGKMLQYILKHIRAEFQNSDFLPTAFELDISDDGDVPALRLEISNGKTALVTGKIDRVDLYRNKEGKEFIRVVDYKTGKKVFYLSDVLYGLNLQMLLYLYILRRSEKGAFVKPEAAGILYMPSNRGMTKRSGEDPLVMNGMLCKEEELLRAMDKGNIGCFIPSPPTRERTSDPMISAEEFETVFDFVEIKVKQTAQRMAGGIFDISPCGTKENDACKFCDFAAVCGVEENFEKQEIQRKGPKDVLAKMQEVIQNGD